MAKERSVLESVMLALNKTGSAGRQGIIDLSRGYREEGDYDAIQAGEREVSPKQFVNHFEDKFDIDLTPGNGVWEDQTKLEATAEVARDIVVDMFTSPDSLLTAPGKLLKYTNIIKSDKAQRAVTGGVIGALSIDGDDSMVDALGKIGIGASTLALGPQAVKGAATAGRKIGEEMILDPIVHNFAKDKLDKIAAIGNSMGFSKAHRLSKAATKQETLRAAEFIDRTKAVENSFIQELVAKGASEDEVAKSLTRFDEVLGHGTSRHIGFRNLYKKGMKTLLEGPAGKEEHLEIMGSLKKHMVDDGTGGSFDEMYKHMQDVSSVGPKSDKALGTFANMMARDNYANLAVDMVGNEKFGGELAVAISEHVSKNKALVSRYNKEIGKRLTDAEAAGLKGMIKDTRFDFIPFHTVDLKDIDGIANDGLARATKPGAKMKLSDEVVTSVEGVSREQAREVGAQRYAKLFLDKTHADARQILGAVAESSLENDSMYTKVLRGYDDILKLQKTAHLVTGTNWIVNNFTDNIVKAYFAAGPMAAVKTLGHNTGGLIHALGHNFNIGALKNLDGTKLYSQMLHAFDPTKAVRKIDYDDNWMNAAARAGVVDSDKFQDFYQLTRRGDAIVDLAVDPSTKQRLMEEMGKGGIIPERIKRMQEYFWERVGSVGSANENTARYITFKEVSKGMLKDLPEAQAAIKKFGPETIMSTQHAKRIAAGGKYAKGLEQAREVMKRASGVVKETFFDYDDVSAFEQQVMKRIFPYWTFMSRNLEFWMNTMAKPDGIKKIGKIESLYQGMGRQPTGKERDSIPGYLLDKGGRIGRNGSIITMPNMSFNDAIDSMIIPGAQVKKPLRNLGQKLSPAVKQAIQQTFNVDMFAGGPLVPTEDKPVKRVFETSLTMLPDNVLELIGMYRDDNGAVLTNNELTARAVSAQRDLLPMPSAMEQAARSRMEAKYRDSGILEAIGKQISPVKTRKLTRSQKLRELRRSERNTEKAEGGRAEVLRKTKNKRSRRKRSRRR